MSTGLHENYLRVYEELVAKGREKSKKNGSNGNLTWVTVPANITDHEIMGARFAKGLENRLSIASEGKAIFVREEVPEDLQWVIAKQELLLHQKIKETSSPSGGWNTAYAAATERALQPLASPTKLDALAELAADFPCFYDDAIFGFHHYTHIWRNQQPKKSLRLFREALRNGAHELPSVELAEKKLRFVQMGRLSALTESSDPAYGLGVLVRQDGVVFHESEAIFVSAGNRTVTLPPDDARARDLITVESNALLGMLMELSIRTGVKKHVVQLYKTLKRLDEAGLPKLGQYIEYGLETVRTGQYRGFTDATHAIGSGPQPELSQTMRESLEALGYGRSQILAPVAEMPKSKNTEPFISAVRTGVRSAISSELQKIKQGEKPAYTGLFSQVENVELQFHDLAVNELPGKENYRRRIISQLTHTVLYNQIYFTKEYPGSPYDPESEEPDQVNHLEATSDLIYTIRDNTTHPFVRAVLGAWDEMPKLATFDEYDSVYLNDQERNDSKRERAIYNAIAGINTDDCMEGIGFLWVVKGRMSQGDAKFFRSLDQYGVRLIHEYFQPE